MIFIISKTLMIYHWYNLGSVTVIDQPRGSDTNGALYSPTD